MHYSSVNKADKGYVNGHYYDENRLKNGKTVKGHKAYKGKQYMKKWRRKNTYFYTYDWIPTFVWLYWP